jgi:hypothetical protein
MTDTMTVTKEFEGWILDAVTKSNTVTLEALKVLTDAVQPVTAALPSLTPPLAYDLAEHLMASEVKFAEGVLQLATKLTPPVKPATPHK